ncbi:hypothetical protein [Metabacillus niabensis]|uniref:DUF8042 domain-containing protein n=1 Tax=Metabacillus niabensis TaxID=324854 RepID=A0ABT9Z575_9BACI|nr:hypothetical protein [Metabacillus niabensis]MDQ0227119.1 hypothetical protein [Metabacillus niabensis]
MISLTEQDVEFLQYYYHLLDTIEEGFDYILNSFMEIENIENNQVFKDILIAFYYIDSSRTLLEKTFHNDKCLLHSIHKFDEIIELLEDELRCNTSFEQSLFMKHQLIPAFLNWKASMQTNIKTYVLH